MRGPLLSGPLGSAAALSALLRWINPSAPVLVLGPLWLGETLSQTIRLLMLVEADDREAVRRVRRRAARANRGLEVALAGAELPLRPRSVGTLVLENVAGLETDAACKWLAALVPLLRPGGRLVAADATSSPAVMARVSGVLLASSLTGPVQERPREGALLTVGVAPPAAIMDVRFPAGEIAAAGV